MDFLKNLGGEVREEWMMSLPSDTAPVSTSTLAQHRYNQVCHLPYRCLLSYPLHLCTVDIICGHLSGPCFPFSETVVIPYTNSSMQYSVTPMATARIRGARKLEF